MSAVAPRMPAPGDVLLERFRVESTIGQGGMGIVLGVRRLEDDTTAAMKVLSLEASIARDSIPRFVNEARAAMRLESAHVVKVFEVGTLEIGLPFIVMELLEGTDLATLVSRRGSLPIAEAVDYVIQAAEGIAAAHGQGIIHRDLKPSNLFLSAGAGAGTATNIVKVLDFGISKVSGPEAIAALTATGQLLGSPHYMAPEQLKNARDVDARADIWSLGVILYELVAGRPPFDASSYGALFAQVLTGEFKPLSETRPNVPTGLGDVVGRCLRRAREERFDNAPQLARALAPFASPDGATRAHRMSGRQPTLAYLDAPPRAAQKLAATALMEDRPASSSGNPHVPNANGPTANGRPSSGKMPVSGGVFSRTAPLPASLVPAPAGDKEPVAQRRSSATTLILITAAIVLGGVGLVLIAMALRSRSHERPVGSAQPPPRATPEISAASSTPEPAASTAEPPASADPVLAPSAASPPPSGKVKRRTAPSGAPPLVNKR